MPGLDMNGQEPNGHTNGYTNGHSTVNGNGEAHSNSNGINSANHTHYANSHTNGTSHQNGTTTNGVHSDWKLPNIPIAICGAGLRLPGGIRSTSDLFEFLTNKKDARKLVPEDRYNIEAYYDKDSKPGTINTKHAYFLDVDLAQFDISMFQSSNAEAATMDPAQRLLLEVTREAFESAGEANFRGKKIGTFLGDFTQDWEDLQNKDSMNTAPYTMIGTADFVLANRINGEYDLQGPSLVVKTACSATAEAVHQAVLAIRAGVCDAAITGGANLILTPRLAIAMTTAGALAPDGSSKTFDASADGFARGESVSVMYIKRLDHAIRDGNPVRAIISATGSNDDGGVAERNFGTPNSRTQEDLIRHTYAQAGLNLNETKVVECHGTGTAVGDPAEVAAIVSCFASDEKLYIGSIKPNVGHGEGGSGMASILKAVVALENKTIIPNIKFNTPNPKIEWDRGLEVPVEPIPWPSHIKERMSINSFGLGGSNAHIVIDSAASVGIKDPAKQLTSAEPEQHQRALLLLSANSAPALTKMAAQYREYLEKHPRSLNAMVHNLANRRERLKLASYCLVEGTTISEPSAPAADQTISKLAFVFTGQGAQWIGMGRELMRSNATFAKSVEDMDRVLKSLKHPPQWTLAETFMTEDAESGLLETTDRAQPTTVALQIAYVDVLADYDITPTAVVGHSSGEIAAAYAAGILSREEAIITAYYRGAACTYNKRPGGMAAIGLERSVVEPLLKPGVVVACENSKDSVTISGDDMALDKSLVAIKEAHADAFARKLRVPMAYHSSHMSAAAEMYGVLITPHLKPRSPVVPFYSTVHGRKLEDAELLGPKYWLTNMESPVLFRQAVKQLLEEAGKDTAFLEVGPHAALSGPLRQISQEAERTVQYVAVASRGEGAVKIFLEAIGKLFCLGMKPTITVPTDAVVLPDLPSYPWQYESKHWSESRVMQGWRFRKHAKHELLGVRILESSDVEPAWRNILETKHVGWLQDHCVGTDVVFPGAGYIAMAGAAVEQMTGSKSFTVQEVAIAAALLLTEKPVELITTLRKRSLTFFNDSKFWEFSIVSENNGVWTKHCWGLVTDGCAVPLPSPEIPNYRRKVDTSRWYTAMARVGLNYGPHFVGMKEIAASPVERSATLTVKDQQDEPVPYPLHPAVLDMIFQSFTVAGTRGEYREMTKLFLPTFVEHLYIGDCANKSMRAHSVTTGVPGTAFGNSYGVIDDQVVLVVDGFKGTMLDDSYLPQLPELKSLSLKWHPAIELAPLKSLVRSKAQDRMDEVFEIFYKVWVYCIAEIDTKLAGIKTSEPHFDYYISKLRKDIAKARESHPVITNSKEIFAMSHEERIAEAGRRDELPETARAIVEVMYRIQHHFVDVVEGKTKILDILLEDDLLTRVYNTGNEMSDPKDFFRLLGVNNPQLRVLEIGAGTGASTAAALEGLISDNGERLYEDYTVTDISAAFNAQCKDRFRDMPNMKFEVLDITKDPLEQGFEAGAYDVIVAGNVLHATPDLTQTLRHCHKLLKPEGWLFMQEVDPRIPWHGFIFGLFEGWWAGRDDGRVDQASILPSEWDERLKAAGFTGCEVAVKDNDHEYFYNGSNYISRPVHSGLEDDCKSVVLLSRAEQSNTLAKQLRSTLESSGYEVQECVFGKDPLPAGLDIICLIDTDTEQQPLLANIDSTTFKQFQSTVKDAVGSAFLWLMPLAQAGCTNPQYGQILGLARTVRAELGIDFATVELQDIKAPAASKAVVDILGQIQMARQKATEADDVDIDLEWMWRDDRISICRAHTYPVLKELTEASPPPEGMHLNIQQRGMLSTLVWEGNPIPALGPNDLRLKVTAVGMNFLDVAIAMGIVDTAQILGDGYNTLGSEGTGVVTEIGSDVKDFSVGDRVVVPAVTTPMFSTFTTRPASICGKIPDHISNEDVAGVLIPYMTVIWSLVDKANMQPGQTLLIHSAAGGVGIATIHVARWLKVKFYCTVGSPAKVDFLVNELGVPREDIFHSRDDSFVQDVLKATGGVGVDVALNSLSGELLHATWRCICPGGAMVEIGKRDFLGRARLAMHLFEENRAYFGVDLSRLAVTRVPEMERLSKRIMEMLDKGALKPLHPTTVFEAEKVEDAFRYMQKGVHMGRIVVRMPEDPATLALTPAVPKQSFRPDRSYLLIGGTGGLGRSIVSWMVANGARSIMLMSRSAGKGEDDSLFVEEMKELKCNLHFVAGDVTDLAFLRSVVNQPEFPIAGVIQLAMVLSDATFLNFEHDTWTPAIGPKVQGTLNLHEVLPRDLDFFIVTGSLSGSLASFAQANYAAANTFLDSFVHYRRGLGLPATVLDIAVQGDVGYVARTKASMDRFARILARPTSEQELLRALQLVITRSSGNYLKPVATSTTVTYGEQGQVMLHNDMKMPLSDFRNPAPWRRDARLTIFRNMKETEENKAGAGNESLRTFLASVAAEPEQLDDPEINTFLAMEIAKRIFAFLMKDPADIDLNQTLSSLGTDSLVGIELRNWWRASLGVEITILELSNTSNTLQTLGDLAVKKLKDKYQTK